MRKCQICRQNEREWMMQPWGPDERVTFTVPGYHYRGFAAIGVCDACKQTVERGDRLPITYRGHICMLNDRLAGEARDDQQ